MYYHHTSPLHLLISSCFFVLFSETVASRAKMLFPRNIYREFMELPDEDSEEEINLEFDVGEIIVKEEPKVTQEVNVISELVCPFGINCSARFFPPTIPLFLFCCL